MSETSPRTATFWSGDAHLLIDYAARSVFVDDSEIALTPTEFDVLACLARRAGEVVSTPELIDSVWGAWYGPADHVFVHVHHIRRKLGPCGRLIVTKRKAGYLLRRELAEPHDHSGPGSVGAEFLGMLTQDALARGVVWFLIDRRRVVLWVSDSIRLLLGWAPADLVGHHPWEFAHEDDLDGFARRFPERGGESQFRFDTRVRHVDGTIVSIGVAAHVLVGLDGDRLGGIGEWRALPDVVTAAAPSSREFRLHYDAQHILVAVDPFEPFLGWHPDEVIGSYFSLAGLDRRAIDRLVQGPANDRREHALGIHTTLDADGQQVAIDVIVELRLNGTRLVGYTGDVRVLDRTSSVEQARLAQPSPREG